MEKHDTCTFKECWFAGLIDKPEQCPNYMENWFYPQGSEPYAVKDCAPRRTVEMLKDVHERLIAIQRTDEQQRNMSGDLVNTFGHVIDTITKNPQANLRLMLNTGPAGEKKRIAPEVK